MKDKRLIQIIEQAAESRLEMLDLSNERLTEIPSEIKKLKNLSKLNLRNNKLSVLPPEIAAEHKHQLLIYRHLSFFLKYCFVLLIAALLVAQHLCHH